MRVSVVPDDGWDRISLLEGDEPVAEASVCIEDGDFIIGGGWARSAEELALLFAAISGWGQKNGAPRRSAGVEAGLRLEGPLPGPR